MADLNYILHAVVLLTCMSQLQSQYYDLFQALQPFAQPQPSQPLNFFNDFTTRRPRPKQKTTSNAHKNDGNVSRKLDKITITDTQQDNARKHAAELREGNQQATRKKLTTIAPIFDINFFTTTPRSVRKTTKAPTPTHKSQNRQESKPKSTRISSTNSNKTNRDNSPIVFFEDDANSRPSNTRSGSKASDSGSNRERPKPAKSANRRTESQPLLAANYESGSVWYSGNRNTVNHHTTRSPYYETTKTYNYLQNSNNGNKNLNYYTTHNPLLNRPGVKPVVINGPPITNRPVTQRPITQRPVTQRPITQRPVTQRPVTQRPVTQRPVTQRPDFDYKPQRPTYIDDDLNVTPEVISGPDEDFMSAVDKKRYIDISERMCDKYKSLNTKQVQAIPLVPSPQPVRVNVSSCPPTTVPLVVGGKVVTIQEFPHMALLGWRKTKNRGYSWKCGGSLLSNQFILTAGHCAYQDRDDNVIAGPPRIVQLGSSYLNDPKAVLMRISAVIRHPKFKQPKAYYDIAIVKMANTVTFSDTIKPACLGTPPAASRPIIATGWGRTEFGGSLSQELRSVSIPVWDMSDCYEALGVSMKIPNGPSSDSQICAGERTGGKDTCQGDSGGPAQIQDGCIWRVVAVTSVGRSCGAAETPAIYATVQRAFISAVVFSKEATQSNDNYPNSNNNNYSNYNYQTTNSNRKNENDWDSNKTKEQFGATNVNQQSSGNRQNSGTNDWHHQSNSGQATTSSFLNNQGNNWSNIREDYNQNQRYPNYNSEPNRNQYNNNFNDNNKPTTERYNSNSRRENSGFYNPSPTRDNLREDYNNNYSRQQDYNTDGRGDTYYNGEGNIWWT